VSRLGRFLHIERSRSTSPEADADASGTADRIGGVESPGRDPGPAASGADLDRFAPPPPPPLVLAAPDEGERPFTRCQRCGMDHHVAAVECTTCGARLDTEEVLAFNDRLWAERRAEAAGEAAAQAERGAARARDDAEAAAAMREAAESLAREVGASERRRLDAELGPGPFDGLSAALEGAGRLLARVVRWIVRN
jgi:hypothetical protein